MRIALTALAALSLAACSKTDAPKAADVPVADAAAPSTPVAADAAAPPMADASASGNAAVKAPHPMNDGPPAAGHNSFTQGQAKGHIENSGYTNVAGLSKDADGVWHATAMKDGKTQSVALDFKGNVVGN
ncbi:MAG: hypothetical protein ABI376_08325 [Caulobacteraceae bacterium]